MLGQKQLLDTKNIAMLGVKALYCAVCLSIGATVIAQEKSNIWVGKLNLKSHQPIVDLVQLTNTDSYSNQPYFFGTDALFYTQMHDLKTGQDALDGAESSNEIPAQTDIHRFDLKSGEDSNLTMSDESEYSATPIPNKNAFSVIRVNSEGLQELWEIDMLGRPKKNLLSQIEPVGYQVWVDDSKLLLFVLGEPHTLQLADSNIGASLYRFKNSDWFLFSKNYDSIEKELTLDGANKNNPFIDIEKGNWLYAYNKVSGKIRRVLDLPEKSLYFTTSNSGHVLTSDGERLMFRHILEKESALDSIDEWQEIKLDIPQCQQGISRIAVSPDDSMIALVCTNLE